MMPATYLYCSKGTAFRRKWQRLLVKSTFNTLIYMHFKIRRSGALKTSRNCSSPTQQKLFAFFKNSWLLEKSQQKSLQPIKIYDSKVDGDIFLLVKQKSPMIESNWYNFFLIPLLWKLWFFLAIAFDYWTKLGYDYERN